MPTLKLTILVQLENEIKLGNMLDSLNKYVSLKTLKGKTARSDSHKQRNVCWSSNQKL